MKLGGSLKQCALLMYEVVNQPFGAEGASGSMPSGMRCRSCEEQLLDAQEMNARYCLACATQEHNLCADCSARLLPNSWDNARKEATLQKRKRFKASNDNTSAMCFSENFWEMLEETQK